jgi:OOP family OmpA-OmpF porin
MAPEVKTAPRAPDEPGKAVPGTAPPAAPAVARPPAPVERLRAILLGPHREQIQKLERMLQDPEALSPVVEKALTASVRRDPRPLADALFPVMGPAIRRAISQALAGMMQSMNLALEHTFSIQGIRWRWEAIRTGSSFAEVVLRHSLLYRVEQLFLVYRESGLLLQHLTAPSVAAQPPDMVAGMLTAIQDFTRDSFHVDQEEMLETMQVGELTVRVEQGARTLLAAVIRGHAPVEFRTEMQSALEAIEGEHAAELASFQGDASPFLRSRPRLESLLLMEAREPARRMPWRSWAVMLLVLAGLAVLLVPRVIRTRRWHAYLDRLRDEPGLIVTDVGRQDGHYVVRGLRDPLARDPEELLSATRLPAEAVVGRWEPYVALLPQFILRRATRALSPPQTISLRLVGDTLIGEGAAAESWFAHAALVAPALAGVGTWRADPVLPRDLPPLRPLVAAVESHRILFDPAVSDLDSAAARVLAATVPDVVRLDSVAAGMGYALRLELVGSADDIGSASDNERLRAERADRVASRLTPLLPPEVRLSTAVAPADSAAANDEERARRRAVFLRLDLSPRAP